MPLLLGNTASAGAASFLDIYPTPYLWYDVSNSSSIIRSGNTVTQINDLSGNNLHSSTTGSPQYSATGWNSKPAISFNGSSQSFSTISDQITYSNAQALNVFMVMNITAAGGLFLEHTPDGNRTTGNSFYVYSITGNSYMYNTSSQTSSYNVTNNGGSWGNGSKLITYRYVGTNAGHIVRRDKVTQDTGSQSSADNPGFSSTVNRMFFMSRGNNGLWTQGTISEVLIYKRSMTFTEMQNIENYLSEKWGF